MTESVSIVVRFLLYGELTLLFGVPLFLAYALTLHERPSGLYLQWQRPLLWLAAVTLITSALGLVVMTAQMTGSMASAFVAKHVVMVVGTAFGHAWTVRMLALVLAMVLLALHPWRRFPLAVLILTCGVALGSLAWGGHAMSFEAAKGTLHLASDIVHLIASGAWLGAIAALLALVFAPMRLAAAPHSAVTARSLATFSTIGTVLVGALVLTGLVNSWALVGVDQILLLPTTLYGQLLLAKLALFVGMLGLAAANRFYLAPQLERAIQVDDTEGARSRLRSSLMAEFFLAVLILALVAILGTLTPPTSQ